MPSILCDFPYPAGCRAVVVDDQTEESDLVRLRREQARLWAARIISGHEDLSRALREAATQPTRPDPLPAILDGPRPTEPLRVQLFLPSAYQGGVWEAARTLVNDLVAVNRRRRQLALALSVPITQHVTGLDADGLTVERLALRVLSAGGETVSVPFSPSLPHADAWFALVDRFPAVLWPVRPLGLIVHDVIQKYVPESFPVGFHTHQWPIIRETIRRASLVITTNEVTRRDVEEAYGLTPDRTRLVHVACEPERRFGGLTPRRVAVPDRIILNPTNAAPHKGAEVMLRGYALLRERRPDAPPLVLCGAETDRFAPSYTGHITPYWAHVRRLTARLGLRPGRDVFFLGFVDDAQLLDLFGRAAAVVNAARFDNGTYSLIEAHYFGKPALCSRYPAAEALYSRFGLPVRYFDLQQPGSLADRLGEALDAPPMDVAAARRALADPRHSYRRYAEEVYDLLLGLARQGRSAAPRRLAS